MDQSTPFVRPTCQSRSRATRDAIVTAGLALLSGRDFDQVSVAEIAARAGISVGGFYARFRSKDALLEAVAAEVIADCTAAIDRALAPARMIGATVDEVIRAYINTMIRKFREHRDPILMILRHARSGGPERQAAVRRFNNHVHGLLRGLLSDRRRDIAHPDPDLAVNMGLFLVSAAAREGVLGDNLRAYPVRITDDLLVTELTRVYVAYLSSHGSGPRARR
jgi:AcrR family transcriptional regulator